MNGFPWTAIGSLIGIAVFVIWMVWRLPRAIDRAERKANQPGRERARLSRRECRQFKRLARRNRKLRQSLDRHTSERSGL